MNILDIVILICFAVSVLWGFKDGVIRQLGSLVGIVVAIIMARGFGDQVGQVVCGSSEYAHIWGFIIVLIVCLIGVSLATNILRKIISVVGLGILDRLAGAVLSAIKCVLILSIGFSLFNTFNGAAEIVDDSIFEESKLYESISSLSQKIVPAIDWISEQIPSEE